MPTVPTMGSWARVPRIDLWRRRAVELSLWYDADFSERFEADFPEQMQFDRPFMSVTSYTRAGRRHVVNALVVREEKQPNKIVIWLSYDASMDAQNEPVSRSFRRERGLLDRLNNVEITSDIRCRVAFEFDNEAATNPWFPLPARLRGGRDDDVIYEIRGINVARLSRPDSISVEYHFELDRYPGRDLRLVTYFSLEGEARSTLPARILSRGVNVAQEVVGVDG